jgi:hypothetical protein
MIGAVVTCRQTGDTAWIIRAPAREGRAWHLIGKITRGSRVAYTARVAGIGDLALVKPAPTYERGNTLEHEGVRYEVRRDLSDTVELVVPAMSFRTRRSGSRYRLPGGNTMTVGKADLVLETL